jgi:Glycine zipper 2TM domain
MHSQAYLTLGRDARQLRRSGIEAFAAQIRGGVLRPVPPARAGSDAMWESRDRRVLCGAPIERRHDTNSYSSLQQPVFRIPRVSVTDHTETSFAKEETMNRLWIPALMATALFSANAFADHDWDDQDHCEHRYHRRVERVVVRPVYEEPRVVYEAPPVVYRERIVYRDRPVYYEAEPRYEEPRPRYYEGSAAYPSYNANRLVGQTIGAVAGGVIGNGIGRGNGRVAATAIGAVVGSVVGGNIADYGY